MIRLDYQLGSGPFSPDALRPYFDGPFVPHKENDEVYR